jgi:methionyl-tRNA formyltransferase
MELPGDGVRIVFAGTPEAALPSLRRLLDSPQHDVIAVLTRPDAVSGRRGRPAPSPVAQLALDAHVPLLRPQQPNGTEFVDELRELAPDCCAVVAFGAMLRDGLLGVPPLGWINLHFSLLPSWRGAAPVQAAIAAGDPVTGATTFRIEPSLDSGPVFGVVTETVRPSDTAGDLLGRLSLSGAELLEKTLDGIADGTLAAVPQPADGVTYAPKITVEEARVRWDLPAQVVDRRIRAVTPNPGAWTMIGDLRVKVGPVTLSGQEPLAPGMIRVDRRGVLVGTASLPVLLGEIQPPGRKPMKAADWARGARLDDAARAQ